MTKLITTQQATVRTERAARTRARIVAAARAAFVARGYRATSLRDVAAAAEISHPGLLRHFATKDALLTAVVAEFEAERAPEILAGIAADERGLLRYTEIARRNASVPGYLALFAALAGEASTDRHPAHAAMRGRYARLREVTTSSLQEAIDCGVIAPGRDARAEAVRLAAAWDGLQLIEQYLPDRVSVVDALEAHEACLARPVGRRDPRDDAPRRAAAPIPPLPPLGGAGSSVDGGYRVGRERRARILADATALFAREGYGDTSLRDVAERVGVSKSTLLHHYGSKEELLRAVLAERDRRIEAQVSGERAGQAADVLRRMPVGAAENQADSPGLIEVYSVLSCEAVPADHPAHEYFAERFRLTIDYLTALLRAAQADGDLPSHRAPEREAVWLTALWDGLQFQWLYDRDAVDVAAHLTAHLDDVLPR